MVAKFPPYDHAAVSAAVAAAVLASTTEVENGNAPLWRPDDKYASEVPFDVISSRRAFSGPGNDGKRFSYLSVIHTDIGREEFGRGTTAFWRRSSTKQTRSRQSTGSSSYSRVSPRWGKRASLCAWA